MAHVRNDLRPAGGGELRRHGVFDHDPVLNVTVRRHVDSLLPLANEQRPGLHHVFAVLRVRCRVAYVRV